MKNNIFIGLGTNLGERTENLKSALKLIEKEIGTITEVSSIYSTKAWGKTNQQDFLNQVIEINTTLDTPTTLQKCLEIEKSIGRVRKEKWGERLIDIDILYFNNEIINTSKLTVPHPFLHQRNFVLVPLVEIAKDLIHPILKKTNYTLLKECKDALSVLIVN